MNAQINLIATLLEDGELFIDDCVACLANEFIEVDFGFSIHRTDASFDHHFGTEIQYEDSVEIWCTSNVIEEEKGKLIDFVRTHIETWAIKDAQFQEREAREACEEYQAWLSGELS